MPGCFLLRQNCCCAEMRVCRANCGGGRTILAGGCANCGGRRAIRAGCCANYGGCRAIKACRCAIWRDHCPAFPRVSCYLLTPLPFLKPIRFRYNRTETITIFDRLAAKLTSVRGGCV